MFTEWTLEKTKLYIPFSLFFKNNPSKGITYYLNVYLLVLDLFLLSYIQCITKSYGFNL